MSLLIVCDEGHASLADPWDRDPVAGIVDPCVVCGAATRLQEYPGSHELRPGNAPPGYDILGPARGGAMAGVFKARHGPSGRVVALKVGVGRPDAPPGIRRRIRREADTLSRLDHPSIVRPLEAGEFGSGSFFSMEWLPGGTLSDRLCRGPLPPREAVGWVAKLGDAIHHAQVRRVVHRDIKPSDIVFTGRGEPKLVDFGIAKRLDRPSGRTRNGAMVDDPRYMAPEQWPGGDRRVGPAVDIHGLGAVLYQAIAGRLPFQDVCLLKRLKPASVPIPAPTAIRPSLPSALDGICLRCLGREPEGRYATAADLAEELRFVYDDGLEQAGRFPLGSPGL